MTDINTDKIKGRVKQAAGDLTDNDDLHAEGVVDEATGEVNEWIDDAADKAEEVVDEVNERLE